MKKIVDLKPSISATRFEAVQPMQSPMHRQVQKIKTKIKQRHNLPGATKPIQAHSAMSQSSQKPLVNSTELKDWVKRLIQEKEVSHYEIHDNHTKKVVGKAKNLKAASRSVDRRDNAYGGYRFKHVAIYKPEPVHEASAAPAVDLDPMTQHRNNFTLRGKHPITFMDGTRAYVHPSTSHRAIDRHSNLREPHDQQTFEQMLHASLSSFRSAVGV